QRFHRQLSCLMSSRTEGLPRIDSDGKPVIRTFAVFPTGNDEEIVANRKARVRLLPFSGPIVFLNNRSGDRWILAPTALKYGADHCLDLGKVGPKAEIQNK